MCTYFLGIFLFSSCEKEDEIATDSISISIYNKDISNYLNLLKTQSNKENSLKIEALVNAIDLLSVKIYTLKTTEKLLVADLKSLKGFETSNKTKAIFFVYENKITHSNIVTFNVKVPFDNLDKVMLSVLDMKKNKDNYTGKISFYNMYQNISLSNEFENGKLTFNGIARRKITKSIIGKSAGCIDWYWVTNSSYEYLYTTCDPCEAYRMSGIKCGGGGGGGSSSGTSGPAYPSNPKNNDLYTYIDQDGEVVTKKYNGVTGVWDLFSISLSDVITYSKPAKYYYLIIQWPYDQQKVIHGDLIYTYDGVSGNWEGVPLADIVIVDPTLKNNPCLNGVYEKLGGTPTFQSYLQKFDGNFSVANLKLSASTNFSNNINADTSPPENYLITITFNENNLNRPSLDIARTFIHEMIHAEMFRKLLSLSSSNGEIDVLKLNTMLTEHNYPGLYDYYRRFGVNNMQHEQMASHYRGIIVDLLKEFDNTLTEEQYQAIAWTGLKETVAWTQMDDLQKNKILDIYNTWLTAAKKNCF